MKFFLIVFICFTQLVLKAQVSKKEFLLNKYTPKVNIQFPTGNNSKIVLAEISYDKKILATANFNKPDIMIWDIETGKLVKKINTSNGNLQWILLDFKFSPDNKKLIISYQFNSRKTGILKYKSEKNIGVLIYDISSDIYFKLTIASNTFKIIPDLNEIVIPFYDKFEVYSLTNFELIKEIKYDFYKINNGFVDISISPKSSYLVFILYNKFVVFDYNNGNLISEIDPRKFKETISGKSFIFGYEPTVNFITDNEILINFDNGNYAVYDIQKKYELFQIFKPNKSINTITALSKDGQYLVTTSKEDKRLRLWDISRKSIDSTGDFYDTSSHNFFIFPKQESFIEDTPVSIFFANDSIVNYIIKGGIIKVNIKTWSLLKNESTPSNVPYHDYYETNSTGNRINAIDGDFLKVFDMDNIVITNDQLGDIRLYNCSNDLNLNVDKSKSIQHIKNNILKINKVVSTDDDLYTCTDKKISIYNIKKGKASTYLSIGIEEEEEEIDTVLYLKGESRFIDIDYIKKYNYLAIAKNQDMASKIIFKSISNNDSSFTYFTNRYLPYSYDNSNLVYNLEIIELKSSPYGNFLIVFWGNKDEYGANKLVTQIIDVKKLKLIATFRDCNYKFDIAENLIAYFVRDKGIEILNLKNSKTQLIPEKKYLYNSIDFSPDSKYLIYSRHNKKIVTLVSINNNISKGKLSNKNSENLPKSENIFSKKHKSSFYFQGLKLFQWGENGKLKLIKNFNNNNWTGFQDEPIIIDTFIFIADQSKIHVLSLLSFKELYLLLGHSDYIKDVFLNKKNNQIVTYSEDGSIKFWDCYNGELLYSKFDLQEGSIYFDKKFRFDCNKAILDSIYLVCGTEIVDLNQVKETLNVPNLVQLILNKADLSTFSNINIQEFCNNTPIVEKINTQDGEFKYRIIPRNGGVGEIEIYINDKILPIINSDSLIIKNGCFELKINNEMLNTNTIKGQIFTIKVIAKSKSNNFSSRAIIQTYKQDNFDKDDSNLKKRKPEVYGIIIGVDKYPVNLKSLNYAAKDAVDFQKVFEMSSKKLFNFDKGDRVHITNLVINKEGVIIGEIPNKNNIISALNNVSIKSKPEDIFFIFFAGHGAILDNKLYLLTTEEPVKPDMKLQGVSTQEILDILSKTKAGKRILFLDACHSGAAINELGLSSIVGQRDIDNLISQSKNSKELDIISSKTGLTIIAASSSSQVANELPEYQHGVLTYSLLHSLINNSKSINIDSNLYLNNWLDETQNYVEVLNDKMPNEKKQTVQIFAPVNYAIGKVDNEVRKSISLNKLPFFYLETVENRDLEFDNLHLLQIIENRLNLES